MLDDEGGRMENEIGQLLLLVIFCLVAIVIADSAMRIVTSTIDLHGLKLFSPSVVYASRDLRVSSDAAELGTQLIEAVDNVGDFLRFVEISAREIASNQRRLFENGDEHPRASGRGHRSRERAVELPGRCDTEAGQLCV
jgi:hypothetical protein